ncbi:hypothetical protein [Verminephrobacter eiseniae]|uniref:hypothetical protein n=1 Tax=Verminephrobacter eiseniae TaxID=364317 RepID=UPI0022389E79|nr:hypothetical protein [Verminephrobacter eiseniae]
MNEDSLWKAVHRMDAAADRLAQAAATIGWRAQREPAMSRLLYWLSGLLPCRIISDNGNPYLERYYVGTAFGVRFYLHRFVGSDPARGLHDHPWPWARSLVLSGWYYEQLRTGTRKVRWFNRLSGDTFHRVILGPGHCWTLFWHRAQYVKPWGFLRSVKGDTALMWAPHNHPQDGNGTPGAWWQTVPRGKNESHRVPRHG